MRRTQRARGILIVFRIPAQSFYVVYNTCRMVHMWESREAKLLEKLNT